MSKITKIFAGIGAVLSLGLAILPLSSYAANPQDVTVDIVIPSTLDAVAICSSAGNTPAGMAAGTIAEVTCTATYSSNGPASVSIKDADANTNLVGIANSAYTIAALATAANLTNISDAASAAWGYKFAVTTTGAVTGGLTVANANVGKYNGVATTAVTVGSNTGVVTGAVGTFTFGVKTVISTPADTYSDTATIAVTASV
ncbi:MAG: hypothetical protein LBT19_01290 [Candidatus Nomurabacteria bacterium]|jgi:hypothetical protein|nr:hypothetical protein [Candidatus Nomurabacteria bacterium]